VKNPRSRREKLSPKALLFEAEAAYADSIFRSALGDEEGMIAAVKRCLEWLPTYAPGLLTLGAIEYQRGREAAGWKLFETLLSLPDDTDDLCEIIDKAGDFLIDRRAYKDGLKLYRAAAAKFPDAAVIHEGLGCCAGHEGLYEEALAASKRSLELEPDNPVFVNDLGWTLVLAGRLEEAEATLERAVAMDPSDELAQGNLRYCREKMAERAKAEPAPKPRRAAGKRRRA
jgi:tetratricopeptide (TPR) repeat protein